MLFLAYLFIGTEMFNRKSLNLITAFHISMLIMFSWSSFMAAVYVDVIV